jgi:YHS domain-containing protein
VTKNEKTSEKDENKPKESMAKKTRQFPLNPDFDKKSDQVKNLVIIIGSFIILLMIVFVVLAPHGLGRSNHNSISSPVATDQVYVVEDPSGEDCSVNCPVCKKTISSSKAEFQHRITGTEKVAYFDTEKCYKKFLENPDKYLENDIKIKVNVDIKPTPTNSNTDVQGTPESKSPVIEEVEVPENPEPPTPEVVPDAPSSKNGEGTPGKQKNSSVNNDKKPTKSVDESTKPGKPVSGPPPKDVVEEIEVLPLPESPKQQKGKGESKSSPSREPVGEKTKDSSSKSTGFEIPQGATVHPEKKDQGKLKN